MQTWVQNADMDPNIHIVIPLNPKSLNLWLWVQLYYINLSFLSLLSNVELQSQFTHVYSKMTPSHVHVCRGVHGVVLGHF